MKVESTLRKLANDILTCKVPKGHVKFTKSCMDYVKTRLLITSTNVRTRLRSYANLEIYGDNFEEWDD